MLQREGEILTPPPPEVYRAAATEVKTRNNITLFLQLCIFHLKGS